MAEKRGGTMMQKVKYRQWCEDAKKFYYWGINIGDSIFTSPTMVGGCMLKTPHEQYTGMNDCNNVEIYDGDICVDSKDNVIRIMQTNSYQWGCKVIKSNNFSIRGLTFPLWQWDDDRKFKKVGNIYENPELMESEE